MKRPPIHGLMAEFADLGDLVRAARGTREAGYRRFDAYTPFPSEERAEAMAIPRDRLPLVVLTGGVLGGLCGYALQYWTSVIAYPLNVGGRPVHSWPAFIPPRLTFSWSWGAAFFTALARLTEGSLTFISFAASAMLVPPDFGSIDPRSVLVPGFMVAISAAIAARWSTDRCRRFKLSEIT